MQGVYIRGHRPQTKKQFREAVELWPEAVELEPTSLFGDEPGGAVEDLAEGRAVYVVGPDPYTDRRWYATVRRVRGRLVVS